MEKAVHGISATPALNWAKAFGLIDADDRTIKNIEALKGRHIFALPCYSVESLYYCVEVMRYIAVKSVELHGGDVDALVSGATRALIDAVTPHKERLCARVCERKVKNKIQAPSWQTIQKEQRYDFGLDLATILEEEKNKFNSYIEREDIQSVIARYPIRETPALDQIATALNFKDRTKYEGAVRKLLIDNEEARTEIRNKFRDLMEAINED